MTKEPIPMPLRQPPLMDRLQRSVGHWSRRARTQSHRLGELLRAARTPEGRRKNAEPLLMLAAATGLVLGLAMGWRRGRRPRRG